MLVFFSDVHLIESITHLFEQLSLAILPFIDEGEIAESFVKEDLEDEAAVKVLKIGAAAVAILCNLEHFIEHVLSDHIMR